MKSAFTLIELIFIIIVVGIIGATAITAFKKDTLTPATIQVLDHIRYTQQLALNQDMFVPSPEFSTYSGNQAIKDSKLWFKRWWQILFHNNSSYSIFSDHPTSNIANNQYDRSVEYSDDLIAKDPQTGLYIAGYLPASSSKVPENERFQLSDLNEEYGVTIDMDTCRYSGGSSTSNRIIFDNMGRPHCNISDTYSETAPYGRLANQQIVVRLKKDNVCNEIKIVPITGFASISWDENCP